MSKFQWMPILKIGTFTAKNGKQVTFDENKLDQIVANTDLNKEPQFVVEHPSYDKLGFGTIEKLQRVGKFLFALPKTVEEKFKNAVNSGELPGRSVSLDEGTLALSSIGFLPKETAPAVDGLGSYSFSALTPALSQLASLDASRSGRERENELLIPISFSNEQSHFAEIENNKVEFSTEISKWPFNSIKMLFRNLKNFFIESYGQEKADEIFNEWQIEEVGNPPVIMDTGNQQTVNSFSQNRNGDTMKIDFSKFDLSKIDPQLKAAIESVLAENKQLETDLANSKVELSSATQKLSAVELSAVRKDIEQFLDTDELKVRVLPAERENTIQYLLSQKAKGKIEFSAPGKPEEKLSIDAFEFAKTNLKNLPKKIELSELATNGTASTETTPDYAKVAAEIAAYANKGRT